MDFLHINGFFFSIAVSLKEFKELDLDGLLKENHVKFDVKAMLSKDKTDSRL